MASTDQSSVIAFAADRLANAFRLYAEATLSSKALFGVDQEEAVDNLDRAFDGVLTGFHSLYDAMITANIAIDWYSHGDTAACILVRNARHHNAGGLFESWNSRMLKHRGLQRMAGATFLLVGYRLIGNDVRVSEYYVPLDDFRARLAMPEARLRDPAAIASLFDRDCAFAAIRSHASQERYPPGQVYLNLIPLAMNAATRVFAALRSAGITLIGFDSTTYGDHFATQALANLQCPVFKSIRSPGVAVSL